MLSPFSLSNGCRAINKSNCYHREGHDAACAYGDNSFMLVFGAIQIVTSQIPDFHNIEWLSVVAAVMSFCYSFIGLGLGLAKTIGEVAAVVCSRLVGLGIPLSACLIIQLFWLCCHAGDGKIKGSIEGISTSTVAEKVWLISQALGDIAFAYPYSLISIEIQVLHNSNSQLKTAFDLLRN